MTPEIALQTAIRLRLADTPTVTTLVPTEAILDRNERPTPDPAIILGEGQAVDEGNSLSRSLSRVWLDLHIWKKEASTEGVKAIAGAIRASAAWKLPWTATPRSACSCDSWRDMPS